MKELVVTMIPDGEIPGAGKLMVHDFVWVMADDCLEASVQEAYLRGLANFEKDTKKLAGKSFLSLTQQDRIKTLNLIQDAKENGSEQVNTDLLTFVEYTKRFAIMGYMQSEYIMTEIMPYSLVPGTFGTCETIDNSKRVNVNA